MEHSVEDVSPVKKKVKIQVSPEEVEGAIRSTAALYRQNAQLDGYRKGKAPLNLIEKRFHDSIYQEARQDLINVHINQILQDLGVEPAGPLNVSGADAPLEKGNPYEYELEIEVAPKFDLPNYEGLEVEEEKVAPDDAVVERILKRLQEERSTLVTVEGDAPATDGQIANIDFETFLDGEPVKDFRTTGFDLEIGKKSALPEFEEFVKTIPVGHTAEKAIHFPDDFIAPELAGKTPVMKVTVHAVKERKLPELDDKFAEQAGKKDMAELREDLAQSYVETMRNLHKSGTQQKLLEMLVRQTDFPLPDSSIETESMLLIGDMIDKAEAAGKRMATSPEEMARLKEEVRPQAEARAREKMLLLAIAKKENLEVSVQDVEKEVLRGALEMKVEPTAYFEKMRETGMIFALRDNMLCDKAMDLIYERAKVTLVDPVEEEPEAGDDVAEGGQEGERA